MGLNLLEVILVEFPSFLSDFDARELALPPAVKAYLAGGAFALAASPCSTPVLATLLAYVAGSEDPITGGALLLTYTSGRRAVIGGGDRHGKSQDHHERQGVHRVGHARERISPRRRRDVRRALQSGAALERRSVPAA